MNFQILALFLAHCFIWEVSGQGLEFYVSVDGSGWQDNDIECTYLMNISPNVVNLIELSINNL